MYNPTRLKVQLKLAINRLKMLQAKKTSLNQQNRREIGTLLEKGKEESARIRVEHIIRDDLFIEAMESLELYCDLLLARFGLLETYKTCEDSVAEAVNTIIWAAPRVGEAKELGLVRDQLASKFGKEFMMQALENADERVNPRIVMKLDIAAPDPFLVERYLEEIARAYDVKWRSHILVHEESEEEEEEDEDDDTMGNGSGGGGGQAELLPPLENEQDSRFDLPEIPTNSPLKKTTNVVDDPNDFDALARLTTTATENKSTPAVTDATFKSTSVALIEKLLQFSTPRLDVKIVNVLFLEGMMDIFMTHVTRLDPNGPKVDLDQCSLEEQLAYSEHVRDVEDLEATKRSYHAMELLSGTTANHLWVQNAKFHDIVTHLFQVFLPNSHGNFNHFFKIFQRLIRRHPCDMLNVVILRNKASILFNYMLPYLTESSITDAILSLIFVRDINTETKEAREKSHAYLQELGFLEWIIQSMQIKEASQVDNGDILFKSLRTDKGMEMMEVLVKNVIDNPPSEERDGTINIIKLLVKSGMLTTRASSMSQPVQGPLYYISLRSQELLIKHIPSFCSLFAKDRHTSNTKIAPLTTSDMDLLDIIYQTLYNANEKTQMLASTPSAFWKILVNSFFEKSSSNIYHTLFYRIVCLTLSINYEPTLIVLSVKTNILHLETRGFILLILNQLRLMADAHHSDLISRIIDNHPRFREFLPTLRTDTLAQLEPIYTWKLEACPRPPAHLGPTPPIQAVHFSPYAGTLPLMTNANDHDEASGIDLGSDYAYCLGFKEGPKGSETPYYLSRRNSNHSDYSLSSSQSNNDTGSDEEGYDCPLCMEELDIADKNFRPCPCGYKVPLNQKLNGVYICRFCWHHIRENLNRRCLFLLTLNNRIQRIRREKKEKERQQKDMETANRRHLANMRVVQKNLVYIIGLHPKLATEETVRSNDYFGQFGKISKIVINKRQIAPTSLANGATSMQPSAAVYVTYQRKEDAGKAIHAVDGSVMAGRILRASYGTTKYCTYYLRNMNCPNPSCLYLHEPGEEADTISKEELATGKHRMRDQMAHDDSEDEDDDDYSYHHHHHQQQQHHHHHSPVSSHSDFPPVSAASGSGSSTKKSSMEDERSALPATASWAKSSADPTSRATRALTPDAFGPPLAVAVAQQQQQQQQQQQKQHQLSPSALKRKLEKKKRKEMMQKQRREEEEEEEMASKRVEEKKPFHMDDGLVQFVLGNAFEEVCAPSPSEFTNEETPVGVSGLYESNEEDEEEEEGPMTPPIEYSMSRLHLNDTMSPLEYLTQTIPTPSYTGTFNPFAHQLLRTMTSSSPPLSSSSTTATTVAAANDSPVRKHSRFGFAQV
ncbi:regulator of Vps4 activity in the MVB pathway-domain-containing protein [Mucor mucedo]|uniref:regulator of Vps4 activity in the MVB pathway-domain-containing protein n=1 Tax=Mucor mucedo TaxID=29922 RepID=UPI002220327C|nr:regulator of Vps4 activity in the MVB pathway-domain-containing protein [Mucor mucedo]KAI7888218.1 regulator of Vps4 activity in the MVB pathway-domain-containing protein [Mucor mucedo]